MKKLKKSRKGAALIMALIVTLVCGLLVTGIFDYVMQYGRYSQWEREVYVNHTTLLSEMQAMKGLVIANNLEDGATRHTAALEGKFADPSGGAALELADLCFDGEWKVGGKEVQSGVGTQRVEVEVYDMFYNLEWISPSALQEEGFPPHFSMTGGEIGSGGETDGGEGGGAIDDTTNPGSNNVNSINPQSYGAYLVRGRLFDHRGKAVRTMEEAFVQILPDA